MEQTVITQEYVIDARDSIWQQVLSIL